MRSLSHLTQPSHTKMLWVRRWSEGAITVREFFDVLEFLLSLLRDIISIQAIKIAFLALVITTACLAVFLLAWGYPLSQLLNPDSASASSGVRHLAAIVYLPVFVLVWFIFYLQIHSERDDLYSGVRQKLVGHYMVTYQASNGPNSAPVLEPALQVPCEIKINPENKKLEFVFKVKDNPIYTDGDDTVSAVALRYDSGHKYELLYYLNTTRQLKDIVTAYIVEDQLFSKEKGIEVRAFGLLHFETGLDKSKVQLLKGEWFDLNGRVTQIFALLDEINEARVKREEFAKKSLSRIAITPDNFYALMGNIRFERIA
jgi:hypothetical protein